MALIGDNCNTNISIASKLDVGLMDVFLIDLT